MVQAQGDVASSVTAHPGNLWIASAHIGHRSAVAVAQTTIESVVANTVIVAGGDGKLCVVELVVVVVAQHHVGPFIVKQGHVAQIHNVVVVSVNVEAVVVQVVERGVIECAEEQSQDTVYDGRVAVGAESVGDSRPVVPQRVSVGTHRGHDGPIPAAHVVIVEAVVVRSVRTEAFAIAILVVAIETTGVATAGTLMARTVVGASVEAAGTVFASVVVAIAEVVARSAVVRATIAAGTTAVAAVTAAVTVAVIAATVAVVAVAATVTVAVIAATIAVVAVAAAVAIAVVAATVVDAATTAITVVYGTRLAT